MLLSSVRQPWIGEHRYAQTPIARFADALPYEGAAFNHRDETAKLRSTAPYARRSSVSSKSSSVVESCVSARASSIAMQVASRTIVNPFAPSLYDWAGLVAQPSVPLGAYEQ